MKHIYKRILCAVLTVLLCVGFVSLGTPGAEAAAGTAGALSWTLNNGTLTITGSGPIPDYTTRNPAPWMEQGESIQRLVIADGVTAVGKMAFYCCENLNIVTLPASVKVLGEQAFAGCRKLAQINLLSVESIGRGCFYECMQLVNVVLGENLHTIADKAFYHCTGLGGITIPASVTNFGSSVFTYCNALAYVRISAKLTVLPYWTFYGCDALWELYLPDEVMKVEENALAECPSLSVVDYAGSTSVQIEIKKQLEQTTHDPDKSTPDVEFTQTQGAVITTVTQKNPDTGGLNTNIGATVTDSSGWEQVSDTVAEEVRHGNKPVVDVYVQADTPIPEGALNDLLDRDVVVNIHTNENVDWQVIMGDQNATTVKGTQDFSVEVEKNTSNTYTSVIGQTDSYTVQLGKTSYNSTVLFPLGVDTARKIATLYAVDDGGLRKLSSVIVDDDGKAAFSVAGTEAGKYIVALDVKDVPKEEVRVPQKLASEYDITYGATLMDAYGNQYVLTGRVNKLGFGMGTLTLIVIGILVGTAVVVGVVMTIWNKQKLKTERKYHSKHRKI